MIENDFLNFSRYSGDILQVTWTICSRPLPVFFAGFHVPKRVKIVLTELFQK